MSASHNHSHGTSPCAVTTRRTFLAGLGVAAASLALTGCNGEKEAQDASSSTSSSEGDAAGEGSSAQTAGEPAAEPTIADDKNISVAASPTPHAVILNGPVRELLEAQGYTLDVQEFSDYVLPNTATEEGEVDSNFFQHGPYLDSFNEERGTHLVSVVATHFEPFGLYAGRTASLDDLQEGAIVAVPNDTTNEARALLLLQQEGLLTLAEDAGITATVRDITDNPLNLEFEELEAATIPTVLADVDIACINGNYALNANLTMADALAVEADDSLAAETYANVLVVREGNEGLDKIKALAEALTSEECRAFIEETFEGAVVPVF